MPAPAFFDNALSRSATWSKSSNGKFILTIAASSFTTAAALILFSDLRRRSNRRRLRDEVERDQAERSPSPELKAAGTSSAASEVDYSYVVPRRQDANDQSDNVQYDDSLIREQLARNLAFLGEDGLRKVRGAFVVVVGLGGVGSAAATMLCRSGVGRLRIIDFDQVTLSSLNVGSAQAYFKRIAPWVKVDARNDLFRLEDADDLLSGQPDFVVDAIDNISTKIHLLKYCFDRKLKVVSSAGAASKADPSRIQISDISLTFEDPLARALRRRLRLEGVPSGIPVVYSTEKTSASTRLMPLDEDEFKKGNVGELSALESFRVRILPVLGPVPGMFGQAAAAHVLTELAGFETNPLPIKNRYKTYKRIWQLLHSSEQRLTGSGLLPLTEDDVAYLFEEMHCARSVVAPTFSTAGQAYLLRWSPDLPLTFDNLACFDASEAKRHEEHVLSVKGDPEEYWGTETTEVMTRRQAEERAMRRWRI